MQNDYRNQLLVESRFKEYLVKFSYNFSSEFLR